MNTNRNDEHCSGRETEVERAMQTAVPEPWYIDQSRPNLEHEVVSKR